MFMLFGNNKWVEYRCSHCGAVAQRHEGTGKPAPGNCPRRNKMPNGMSRPHIWVVNRKYGK